MKVITFQNPDSTISVVTPCICQGDPEGFTHDDAVNRAMKDIPDGATAIQVVEHTELPSAPIEAWTLDGAGVIAVSQEKLAAIVPPKTATQRLIEAFVSAGAFTEKQGIDAIAELK